MVTGPFSAALYGLPNPDDAPEAQGGSLAAADGQPQQQAEPNPWLNALPTGPAEADASGTSQAPNGEVDGPNLPPVGSPEAFNPAGGQPGLNEPGLSDPTRALLDAPVAGAVEAVSQTKDFLTGATPQDQKSDLRKNAEATRPDDGLGYSLSKGVAQFGLGLLGAGKLLKAAEGVEAIGSAIGAVRGARGGAAALESAKAASVGAIAFDPHAERLSNLIQSSPALANPVNAFLAAKPDDSAAAGRLKNAMESLGMDAALIGVVGGTMRAYKALGAWKQGTGSAEEAVKATDGIQGAMDDHNAIKARQEAQAPRLDANGQPELTVTPQAPAAGAGDGKFPVVSDATGEHDPNVPLEGEVLPPGSPEVDVRGNDTFKRPGPGMDWEYQPKSEFDQRPLHPDDPRHADNWHLAGKTTDEIAALPAEDRAPPPPEVHTDLSGREFTRGAPEQPLTLKAAEQPAPEPEVVEAKRVASPTAGAPEGGLPANPSELPVLPEEARSIYEGAASDMEAFQKFGTWEKALDGGHIFGKGGSIPYQKLVGGAGPGRTELGAFVDNIAEQLEPQFDAAKGGAVLSDAALNRMVGQRAQLYGEDPAALMGILQRAGDQANSLAANLEASYMVAQRGYQDAYALAARIKAGDLSGFDNVEGAMAGLRQRLDLAASAWASGQSMRAAMGRGMRRLRGDFRVQQDQLDAMKGMDPDALVELLNTTGGDPRLLHEATRPAMLQRVKDAAQFLYTNNLLWSFRTHFINFSTNFYMVAARPAERILGSLVQTAVAARAEDHDLAEAALQTRREALQSYTYMAGTLTDSWKSAVEVFKQGDSIMAPHSPSELATGAGGHGDIGRRIAQMKWRPWDSLANVTANALMVATPKAIGLPSRTIGMVDEFIKNISYRSNVMAKAHMEGVSSGLIGDDLSGFVRDRLYGAFDDAGRAVDAKALQEAKVATFQQNLLPGSLGAGLQGLTGNVPWTRYILPFVRTPTNVLRYGWKLTPGLNVLQGEYRNMLTGGMGQELQAQAIGQMAMGSLFMGVAAMLHHTGALTGGGPSNPVDRAKLRATGWQPYSFVITTPDGGLTYVPYGRFDPVAMPFGMVADIGDVLHAHEDDPNSKIGQSIGTMMLAAGTSMAKAFSEKSYLKSVDDTVQFVLDPDRKVDKLAGQYAANFVPASSLLRNTNPDPYLRDARTFLDNVIKDISGFSETVPARRDAFGDPITAHRGLWINSPGDLVDAELRRMGEVPDPEGKILGPPPARFKGGIDLRDVTMVSGQNAYDRYQELARQPSPRAMPIKDVVAKVMQTDAYKRAPDGDSATKGTKLWIIANPMRKYREAAERIMMADKNVREAAYKKQMAAASAYANRAGNQNPTPGNAQNAALGKLQGAFSAALNGQLPPQQH